MQIKLAMTCKTKQEWTTTRWQK